MLHTPLGKKGSRKWDWGHLWRKFLLPTIEELTESGIKSDSNVEEALNIYNENGCGAIIALGGGSVMDCAKAVGARAVNPEKPLNKMKGLLKVKYPLPPLF